MASAECTSERTLLNYVGHARCASVAQLGLFLSRSNNEERVKDRKRNGRREAKIVGRPHFGVGREEMNN